jgi:hypothetical protein
MYLKLTANNPYPHFDIYDEDKPVISIKIDQFMQALRIACKDSRRVFFVVEEKMKRNSVWCLLNEYSQPLGSLMKDKSTGNEGEVKIEGSRFTYRISSSPVKEIIVFKSNEPEETLICRINDALMSDYKNYLIHFIFALSWFTFLSHKKKTAMDFAGSLNL